jgi:hypothetical protein
VINYWSINCLAQWSEKSRVTLSVGAVCFVMMILEGQAARVDQIRGREDWSGALGA